MKRITLLYCFIIIFLSTACNRQDKQDRIIPVNITDLTAERLEGAVKLKWKIPTDANFLYVRLQYQNPATKQSFIKNISIHTDSIIVGGMLAKDGEYTFSLQTVSSTEHVNSMINEIKCIALPVQPRVEKKSEKISLTMDNLSTNAQEPSEGPIEDLIDGNITNFFHTAWSIDIPAPHYIDIALSDPISNFEFTTWYRNGNYGSCPSIITLLGSNDNKSWDTINTLEDDGSGLTKYVSPVIECDKPYTYLRYRCDETPNGDAFFSLAEMELSKVSYDIYDPEGIYPKTTTITNTYLSPLN